MYCGECGTEIGSDNTICPKCGKDIVSKEEFSGKPEYKKLGGWLMFFFVYWVLASVGSILCGIRYCAESASYFSQGSVPGYSPYTLLGVIVLSAGVLFCINALINILLCINIKKKNPKFLKTFQLLYLIFIALLLVWSIAGQVLLSPYGTVGSALTPSSILSFGGGLLYMILISVYFCKSERVRTYMGDDEYIKCALMRFHDKKA